MGRPYLRSHKSAVRSREADTPKKSEITQSGYMVSTTYLDLIYFLHNKGKRRTSINEHAQVKENTVSCDTQTLQHAMHRQLQRSILLMRLCHIHQHHCFTLREKLPQTNRKTEVDLLVHCARRREGTLIFSICPSHCFSLSLSHVLVLLISVCQSD